MLIMILVGVACSHLYITVSDCKSEIHLKTFRNFWEILDFFQKFTTEAKINKISKKINKKFVLPQQGLEPQPLTCGDPYH